MPQVLVHDLKINLPLVHMVDKHPQLILVLVSYPDNIRLGSDNLVACRNNGHLLNLRVRHRQKYRQALLELLDNSLRIRVLLQILNTGQAPQTLEHQVWVIGLLGGGLELEDWLGGATVVRDGLSSGG